MVGLGDKVRAFLADAGAHGPVVAIDLSVVDDDSLNHSTRSESEWKAIRRRADLLPRRRRPAEVDPAAESWQGGAALR